MIVVGVLSSILQNKPRLVLERIKPDYSRISITKGFERIMGVRGQVEFLKALIKFIIICVAVVFIVQDGPQRVISYMLMNQFELPQTLISEIAGLFVSIGICVGLLAGVDLVWARLKWQIDLRMSRQDLKEEHKQAEGDPIVRARQRSLARDRARRRMMAA
ncbi:MAG: EscU/YscU/HrcU family type III secretion system export apparatus switch protein, partial [Hyphomicrobiaceae bacterium]